MRNQRVKTCCLLLPLFFSMVSVTHADKYDAAVETAIKSTIENLQKEKDLPKPTLPPYDSTLKYIQDNVEGSFTEINRCHFLYEESFSGGLTIIDFFAEDLEPTTAGNLALKCKNLSDCINRDYRGHDNRPRKQVFSWGVIYLTNNTEDNRNILAENLNNLIRACKAE